LLCRARTGSGKTLCYAVPLVQRLLVEAEAKGASPALGGLVLVPTKELIVQVHGVITSLLAFCFDVLTVEPLLSGQKYMKAELPAMLVTTPSSLLALVQQRKGTMQPLANTLRTLVVDEADLMFSFGYETDMRALCVLMPSTYQAMLVSATLSEEVEQLKGLMLHKPVVLKLEEPRVTGKLSQFYLVCHKSDKYLILYTLLKLQLVQGKILMFVKSIESAYRMKIFLERFSINSAVLNAELPHASRQNIIQAFNQSLVELLIATDAGFGDELEDEAEDEVEDEEAGEEEEQEEEEEAPRKKKKRKRKGEQKAAADAEAEAEPKKAKKKAAKKVAKAAEEPAEAGDGEEPAQKKVKRRKKMKGAKAEDDGADEDAEAEEDGDADAAPSATVSVKVLRASDPAVASGEKGRFGRRRRPEADQQFSLTRGVDLQGVTTVINVDVPATVRDYTHRVGRCARGGASGTALTLCNSLDGGDIDTGEEALLQRIIRSQASRGSAGELRPLPMQITDAERFRYRVEDMARGLTKKAVAQYRARELQLEALHSEKLKEYFEEHPEDRRALQKTQRQLRERKSVRQHLAHVPTYLVPEQFANATPVQQAVREEAASRGAGQAPSAAKRRRALRARDRDPLQGLGLGTGAGLKRNDRFKREVMIARERRIDSKTANVEELPPLSGRKLWKLRHKKHVRAKTNTPGERKRKTPSQLKRQKKFGF